MVHRERREGGARRTSLSAVRIRGQAVDGKPVSQVACTLNVSSGGARLVGVKQRLKIGSVVRLQYHQEEARFEVAWTRRDAGTRHWQAGLRCLEPEKRIWALELDFGLEPEQCRQLLKQALAETRS